MSREDIIRMARDAGTPYVNRHFQGQTSYGFTEESLLHFASLVAEAKQEECAKVAEFLTEPQRAKIRHVCDDGAPCFIAAAIRALK